METWREGSELEVSKGRRRSEIARRNLLAEEAGGPFVVAVVVVEFAAVLSVYPPSPGTEFDVADDNASI